jgi:Arc/MetJ-type ribon-helix-helix transcriptional regulator
MDGAERIMPYDDASRLAQTEKITINMGAVELGKVDLLVGEGFYSNRSDFIRSAIRSQLDKHQVEVQQAVARNAYIIGLLNYDRKIMERLQAKGERIRITVVGMLRLAKDIPPELATEVIESVQVYGMFHASDAVKAALADRTN